ncbi:LPS export ABC transporter periplasmic protein LptC [Luteimonas yindakuii]|uniref:LPS export ABC transporter periplasmic protein LptC n=1 Tax=Luteimonas yindakuii TaxID=2565782 RepID=UPI0011077A50|nr:LPS export ABC transporter periplasmic protein LptC [Luteimonas yindakuii]QCU72438.1 LPS export ABC transporter periplasmic protein LptC [Luteimonas yindakuii]
MSWRGWLAIVLVIAAVVSGWSAWRQRADAPGTATGPLRSDYVLRDFELIALNNEGRESFTLRAPLLEQNPADRTIAIETPLFLVPERDGGRWQARSQTGWVSASHDELRLEGDVRMTSPDQGGRDLLLTTTRMTLLPETNIARSDELVTIQQPGSRIQGLGMQVDLTTKRYEFSSQVKQRYEPRRR